MCMFLLRRVQCTLSAGRPNSHFYFCGRGRVSSNSPTWPTSFMLAMKINGDKYYTHTLAKLPPEESTPAPMQPRGVSYLTRTAHPSASAMHIGAGHVRSCAMLQPSSPTSGATNAFSPLHRLGLQRPGAASQPAIQRTLRYINDFRSLEWQFSRRTLAFVRVCAPSQN